jgi:hypothetical protein
MSDYPTLDAKVFGANGDGQTVREIMALGCGRAYQQLRGLEGWPGIVAAYEAERTDRLAALRVRFAKLFKQRTKALWWLEHGLRENFGLGPTEDQMADARADYDKAVICLQKVVDEMRAVEKEQNDRWDAVAPPLTWTPDGLTMIPVGNGCVPKWPWSSDQKVVTVDFAGRGQGGEQGPPIHYPEDTILRLVYTSSSEVRTHYEIKAVIAGGQCLQTFPMMAFNESVEIWVKNFPSSVRARFTVSLPAA